MEDKRVEDELPEKEIGERMDKALRRSFNMPHQPHKPPPPKGKARPASKGRVRKGRSRS
jgi:hypothetical protein